METTMGDRKMGVGGVGYGHDGERGDCEKLTRPLTERKWNDKGIRWDGAGVGKNDLVPITINYQITARPYTYIYIQSHSSAQM